MQRIEHLLAGLVAPLVPGDHLVFADDLDAIDVRFHRHGLKRKRPRHAVAIRVPGHRLVLVHRACFTDRRIKATLGQRHGQRFLHREPDADRLGLTGDSPLPVTLAASARSTRRGSPPAAPAWPSCVART